MQAWADYIDQLKAGDKKVVSMGVTTPLSYSTFGAYSQANIIGEGRTFALQGRFNF